MENEIQQWIAQLERGEPQASQQLWEAFYSKLVVQARRRLGGLPRREADEEDVALSAINSFIKAARNGRFPLLRDETDLWRLLVVITSRKISAQRRRHFRVVNNQGKVRGESVFQGYDQDDGGGIDACAGYLPTPLFSAQVAEECQALLDKLGDPELQDVARWKMEGYDNKEIGVKLGLSERGVQRRLTIIRKCWTADVQAL